MAALNMLKIFVMCIVINIIGNFLIKSFSIPTKLSKTEIVLPTYQLQNVTYIMKIT